jgi:hypothetical protein
VRGDPSRAHTGARGIADLPGGPITPPHPEPDFDERVTGLAHAIWGEHCELYRQLAPDAPGRLAPFDPIGPKAVRARLIEQSAGQSLDRAATDARAVLAHNAKRARERGDVAFFRAASWERAEFDRSLGFLARPTKPAQDPREIEIYREAMERLKHEMEFE